MGSDDKGGDKGLGGLLRGFTDLIGKLGELAESGEALSKTGSFDLGRSSGGAAGKPSKGVFGLSVKVGGLGGKEVEIEPFGNIRRDQRRYRKSIQVPDRLRREDVAVSCNNGIIEISYAKT